jgi:hypothetical protein
MKSAAAWTVLGACRTVLGASVLCVSMLGAAARADDGYLSPTEDRVRLSLGIVEVGSATQLRVDNAAGTAGTNFDAESDLGLDRHDLEPSFAIMVRGGENNRLQFDYFTLDRSATKTLTLGPSAYGDVTLLNGDPVQTQLDMRLLGITYGYSFWHSDWLELAATLSVNDAQASNQIRVDTATRNVYARQDLAGPVPTLGLAATWVVNRHFYLDGGARYVKLAIHHDEGSLGIYELDAVYRFHPNVAIALGFEDVHADLMTRRTGDNDFFRFDFRGPQLLLRVAF